MKKALIWLAITAILVSSPAFALDMGDMFGNLTSMFSPSADEAYGPQETAELNSVNIKLTNVMESDHSSMYA